MIPARLTPEQLLHQVEEEERAQKRGRLKVFLGYSARVGKSFRMLDEGRRRALRGQDVVVGAIQSRRSAEEDAVLAQLEVIPMRAREGALQMDVPAILRRRPEFCLIDGLAYHNPPGSEFAERWQEAEHLLACGISVVVSLNLQFIAERRPAVAAILGGSREGPTVPESFLHTADEIEVVDTPPELAERGNLRQLAELRELALLLAADVVDQQLERYLLRHGIEPAWGAQERILLCLTDAPAQTLIASGRRNAERFHGELLAVHVARPGRQPSPALHRNLEAARAAGAEIVRAEAADFVAGILQLARARGVTQIFLGHPRNPPRWWHRQRWTRSPLDRLIEAAEGADLRIFPVPTAETTDGPG
jgi:two-component system sensor histidine kinase KdpD